MNEAQVRQSRHRGDGWLSLSRRVGDRVVVSTSDGLVLIDVTARDKGQVSLAIQAPRTCTILRVDREQIHR
jgi:sRNA-binding carbon storage regulator CsrA